jgi:hypothetical protein
MPLSAANRALLDAFTRAPGLLREAVRDLGAGEFARRPPGQDWSVRDVVHHLADDELVRAVRIRLAVASPGAPLPAYDEGAWQRRLQYLWRSPELALATLDQVRFGTAEILQRLDDDGWARHGVHPERGELTVAAMVQGGIDHVTEHVAQVEAIRAALRQ